MIFTNRNELRGFIDEIEDTLQLMARDIALLTNRTKNEVIEEYFMINGEKYNSFLIGHNIKPFNEPTTLVLGDLYKQGKLSKEMINDMFIRKV